MYRVKNIGKKPICNLKSDRAPHIFGLCFPLCWRCTAVAIGNWIIAPIVFGLMKVYSLSRLNTIVLAFILFVPMLIDGLRQYFFLKKESTNLKRFITGSLSGLAIYLMTII